MIPPVREHPPHPAEPPPQGQRAADTAGEGPERAWFDREMRGEAGGARLRREQALRDGAREPSGPDGAENPPRAKAPRQMVSPYRMTAFAPQDTFDAPGLAVEPDDTPPEAAEPGSPPVGLALLPVATPRAADAPLAVRLQTGAAPGAPHTGGAAAVSGQGFAVPALTASVATNGAAPMELADPGRANGATPLSRDAGLDPRRAPAPAAPGSVAAAPPSGPPPSDPPLSGSPPGGPSPTGPQTAVSPVPAQGARGREAFASGSAVLSNETSVQHPSPNDRPPPPATVFSSASASETGAQRSAPASPAGPLAGAGPAKAGPIAGGAARPDGDLSLVGIASDPDTAPSGAPAVAQGAMPSAQATAPATAPLPASVSQQIVAALSQVGAGQVDVALSPEELGRVRLSLSVSDTGIAVHVAAERPETLALIRRHIDMLAQDFRAIGYDSVEFGFSDQPGAGRDGGDARRALGNGALLGAVADAPAPRPQITLSAGLAGGLDLRL